VYVLHTFPSEQVVFDSDMVLQRAAKAGVYGNVDISTSLSLPSLSLARSRSGLSELPAFSYCPLLPWHDAAQLTMKITIPSVTTQSIFS